MIFATIFLAFIAGFLGFVLWSYTYWWRKGVPFQTPFLFFGNFTELILQRTNIGAVLRTTYETYKPKGFKFVGMYFFTQPLLLLLDTQLIKTVLVKDFDHFVDRGIYVNEKEDPIFAHLFSLPGDRWRRLRVKLTPTYTSGKMKMMFSTVVRCSEGLNRAIEAEEGAVEIKDIVARYTTDVIGSCAFGIECNSLLDPDIEFRVYGRKFFNPDLAHRTKLFCTFFFPKAMALFNARTVDQKISDFFMGVVKETMDYRQKNRIDRKDFMQLLLQLHNSGKVSADGKNNKDGHDEDEEGDKVGKLTVEQIAAQCFLFFIAGFETSSTALGFCMYELAKNPKVQDKVRREIEDVLQKHNGDITYEGVALEMKYMEQVINETLRMYPPVPLLNRTCTKDYSNPDFNFHVKKGEKFVVATWGLHMDPEFFPEPETFNPDRFADATVAKTPMHPYTFLPFGAGPRNCIGLRFGIMQTKVALMAIVKNFRFVLDESMDASAVPKYDPVSLALSFKGGININFTKL